MSVTVINKVKVGKNVKIGAGALILKDIPDDYEGWVKGIWKG
jgi:serine acetyltransferase